MSDVTPIVGPVYGFRTWDLTSTGSKWIEQTTQLRSRGTTWEDPTQEARCLEGNDPFGSRAIQRMLLGQPARSEPEERHDHPPVSDPKCWCGLYAHSTLARCLDAVELSVAVGHKALGLVRASGRVIAAERGFRAERMTIDTLVCIYDGYWPFRRHQDVHDVASDLGVPIVCARLTKASLNRAFADREGVHLWTKEAPWTSDVTSESTTSSTRQTPSGMWRANLDDLMVLDDPSTSEANSAYQSPSTPEPDGDETEGAA